MATNLSIDPQLIEAALEVSGEKTKRIREIQRRQLAPLSWLRR